MTCRPTAAGKNDFRFFIALFNRSAGALDPIYVFKNVTQAYDQFQTTNLKTNTRFFLKSFLLHKKLCCHFELALKTKKSLFASLFLQIPVFANISEDHWIWGEIFQICKALDTTFQMVLKVNMGVFMSIA